MTIITTTDVIFMGSMAGRPDRKEGFQSGLFWGVVMDEMEKLEGLANQVAKRLTEGSHRLVLAESCTCGLIASLLGGVPGISSVLCGSAVTYREATKMEWLNVSQNTLAEETAVSDSVALQMAEGALRHTPEANCAASITGHLGPNAPKDQDGLVFVGFSIRRDEKLVSSVRSVQLKTDGRARRRREAVQDVLELLLAELGPCKEESP